MFVMGPVGNFVTIILSINLLGYGFGLLMDLKAEDVLTFKLLNYLTLVKLSLEVMLSI